MPRIICSTIGVKKLRNYIQRSKHVQHEDSHVYYVRDDYAARKVCSFRESTYRLSVKHHNFPIPPALDSLERQIDHFSAIELVSEVLGKRK